MAEQLKPKDELSGGRYQIKRVIDFSQEGGSYQIARVDDSTKWALKELIPPEGLDEAELESRVEGLKGAIELLRHFDHPLLAKVEDFFEENGRYYVVLEWVDGITLEKLEEMSINPQPEEKVLSWAEALMKAIHYCHDRPEPYVFNDLGFNQIMLDQNENLKIINYGLGRFLRPPVDDDPKKPKPNTIARDALALGYILAKLLTKKEPSPVGIGADDNGSPEFHKVINRMLLQQRGQPVTFDELLQQLDKVINPPVYEEYKKVYNWNIFVRLAQWNQTYSRAWAEGSYRFLKQPIWLVAVELILVLGAIFGVWYLTHPPLEPRTGRSAYVACGEEIYVIDLTTRKVTSRIQVDRQVHGLAASADGKKMFVSLPAEKRILVLNTLTNRFTGIFTVHEDPRKLLVDDSGRYLLVVHPEGKAFSIFEIDSKPLPDADKDDILTKAEEKLVTIVQVGKDASDAAVITRATEELAEDTEGIPEAIPVELDMYLSSVGGNKVFHYLLDPEGEAPKMVNSTYFEGAGPLVLAPDEKMIFVASNVSDRLQAFRLPEFKLGPIGLDAGGQKPVAIFHSPLREEVWVVNGTGSVGVLATGELDLRDNVVLGGEASAAQFVMVGEGEEAEEQVWVALQKSNELVLVNPLGRSVELRFAVGDNPTAVCVVD